MIDNFIEFEYNKIADRNMLYIHETELAFKRHVMSSDMEPP